MVKKKVVAGLGLTIVALVLLSFTFLLPWYNYSIEPEDDDRATSLDLYFDEMEISSEDYDGTDTERDEYPEDFEPADVLNMSKIFVMISIFFTALGSVGAFIVATGKLSPKVGAVLVLIGFIIALIAPVYMMVSLPDAWNEEEFYSSESGPHESFFGSSNEDIYGSNFHLSWGGTYSWFMSIAAGILNLVAFGTIYTTKSMPERMQYGYDRQRARWQQQPSKPNSYDQPFPTRSEEDQRTSSKDNQPMPPPLSKESFKESISEKKERLNKEIDFLKEEEKMIDTREIETLLEENKVEEAEELFNDLKENYEKYKDTLKQLGKLDDRKSRLAEKLADGEIDRKTYSDASESVRWRKSDLEEELNRLRKEVIYEDYQKPF